MNLLIFEFLFLNAVLLGYLLFIIPDFWFFEYKFLTNYAPLAAIYNFSWLFIVLYIRDKEFYFNPNYSYLKNLLTSLFFFVGLVITLVILLKVSYFRRSSIIFPIFIFSYLNLIFHKYLLRYFRIKSSRHFSNTLLIGSSKEISDFKEFKRIMAHYGYNIVGYLDKKKSTQKLNLKIEGCIKDLSKILSKNAIDEIFIDMSALRRKKVNELIAIADEYGIRVKLIPEYPLLLANNYKAITMGDIAVFKLRQSPLDDLSMTIIKRLFDVCFSLFILIVCIPIFLILGIIIFLDTGGPIFYKPLRKGEAGETFRCYKFRTMSVNDNPINGTKSTVVNDPRITRIGKYLRKFDLDELPQFYNVLKGDMSVIGPRPHRINLQNDFRKCVNDYMVRSYIKPGISGWAQVNGWRGPTVTDEQKFERVKHDLWYIENWSFWLDLKIIFLTIFGKHHKEAF